MRVGIGYDIHALVRGRKLILGGVHIPFAKGLKGHSDADVLLHAVCDALLGAVGAGDIGQHFPDNDTKYKDICSMILLGEVANIVKKRKFKINNIDAVVIAESPRMSPFFELMKKNIAEALRLKINAVNIKATTHEGLGSIGKGQGICAYAVACVSRIRYH